MEEMEFNFKDSGQSDENIPVYSVSQISQEIKNMLEDSYPAVRVEGEVSNFKTYNSGHSYFNLKEEKAQIKAVMFEGNVTDLTFIPEDGMNVLVFGRISAYPARGDYQIIVSSMEQAGEGDLAKAFEKLKKKLEAEGMFDNEHKKEIPSFINKIGVVTSKDGAALHDILKVLDSLNADVSVLIYPVRVQGKEAEKEISEAIQYLNKEYEDLDVLLVGRGGGSMEDLWAFNTERVARAIYKSKIPVISCVGHEIDFTIADFTADLRAATPSAAAEIAVRKKIEMINNLKTLKRNLFYEMQSIIENSSQRLENLSKSRALQKPYLIYEDKIAYVDDLSARLKMSMEKLIVSKETKLKYCAEKLNLVSPLNILKRGFSIVKDENGKILKSIKNLSLNMKVKVELSDGGFEAKVENFDKEK
ncbi:MAG: exodeoxyribonuclease VII large subunit [Elusimicrobiota bacterium]|jgi:exodeoxyribonuclease VII large subunit|nr:exodeoxyribonuclease VII large subunit [Elusimicrobiota bacterium]